MPARSGAARKLVVIAWLGLATLGATAVHAAPVAPTRTMTGSNTWIQLPPPSVRQAGVAYDRAHDRLIVFGGANNGALNNDTWAVSLSGSPSWTKLATTGTPPSPRQTCNAVYDPAHNELVVFGGSDAADNVLGDVWTLSLAGATPTWTQLSPAGSTPAARSYASAALDTLNDRLLVFGGAQTAGSNGPPSNFLNDVWALSLSGTPTWTQLSPSGTAPSVRAGSQVIWDGAAQRLVAFGGFDGGFLADAYTLSLSGSPAWNTLSPGGTTPAARAVGSAVWDPVGNRMLMYGGFYSAGGNSYLSDLWSLSLGGSPAWTQLSPTGGPPSTRQAPEAAYDSHLGAMVMYGGGDDGNGGTITDLAWRLSLGGSPQWTEIGTGDISQRQSATAIFDPVRQRLVAFGGQIDGNNTQTYSNEVWTYDLAGNWSLLTPTGTPPTPRSGQTAIYDPVRDRMLVFAGGDTINNNNDAWALSLSGTPAWTLIATSGGPPPARQQHVAVYDSQRDRMVIYGGSGPGDTGATWALDLGTNTWSLVAPSAGSPGNRFGAGAVYDPLNDRMVVYGGSDDGSVWALGFGGSPAWSQLSPTGTPPPGRYFMSAAYDPAAHSMITFGGATAGFTSSDSTTSMLHLLGTPQWSELNLGTPSPSPRQGPMSAFDGGSQTLYVSGGCCQGRSDTWMVTLDLTVPVTASMVSASATSRSVEVKWWVPERVTVTIQRNDQSGWRSIGTQTPDGTGLLDFHDAYVAAGRRYGYRISVPTTSGATQAGEVWLDVPASAVGLSLGGFLPNPARAGTAVRFTLPSAAPARLEMLDVAGRTVMSTDVGSMGAGQHQVHIDGTRPGVYIVRLTQAGHTVSGTAVLLPR